MLPFLAWLRTGHREYMRVFPLIMVTENETPSFPRELACWWKVSPGFLKLKWRLWASVNKTAEGHILRLGRQFLTKFRSSCVPLGIFLSLSRLHAPHMQATGDAAALAYIWRAGSWILASWRSLWPLMHREVTLLLTSSEQTFQYIQVSAHSICRKKGDCLPHLYGTVSSWGQAWIWGKTGNAFNLNERSVYFERHLPAIMNNTMIMGHIGHWAMQCPQRKGCLWSLWALSPWH